MRCSCALEAAEECDLIDEHPARLSLVGNSVWLGPFEIRTLRLLPRRQ